MNARAVIKEGAIQAWREVFDHVAAELSGDVPARRDALERFLATGFPTKRQELWKYTDLSGLADARFQTETAAATPAGLPQLDKTRRVVFVNGCCMAGVARAPETATARPAAQKNREGVYALNAALASDGLDLHVVHGETLPCPVHVISYRSAGDAPTTSHLHHRIELGENAQADVILESCGRGAYLGTEVTDITLGAGARLCLYRIQDVAAGATELADTHVEIGRDATFEAYGVDLGRGLARHDFNVALCAAGAAAELHALSVVEQRAHADNHVRVEHRAPHGRSRIAFRGIAADRAQLVFDGLIRVDEGAVKTDSDQRLAALLLSPRAEINVKPELEIYNDDVRCNHGSATGQLDPLALFYLRSRGVDELAAREMLTLAFVSTVLETVPLASVRNALRERIGTRLRSLLAAPAAVEHAA